MTQRATYNRPLDALEPSPGGRAGRRPMIAKPAKSNRPLDRSPGERGAKQ
jgi:hypothetical protein